MQLKIDVNSSQRFKGSWWVNKNEYEIQPNSTPVKRCCHRLVRVGSRWRGEGVCSVFDLTLWKSCWIKCKLKEKFSFPLLLHLLHFLWSFLQADSSHLWHHHTGVCLKPKHVLHYIACKILDRYYFASNEKIVYLSLSSCKSKNRLSASQQPWIG